jgi:hypothetical protein
MAEMPELALTLVGIDIVIAAQDLVGTINFGVLEYAFSVPLGCVIIC